MLQTFERVLFPGSVCLPDHFAEVSAVLGERALAAGDRETAGKWFQRALEADASLHAAQIGLIDTWGPDLANGSRPSPTRLFTDCGHSNSAQIDCGGGTGSGKHGAAYTFSGNVAFTGTV